MSKFAVLFPGQGSQSIGMLDNIYSSYPEIKTYIDTAGAIINQDLWKVVTEGPIDTINNTSITQPLMLSASFAIYKLLCGKFPNLQPSYLCGHSLGEYTALVAGNSIKFEDAIKLVYLRGKLMSEALGNSDAGEGAMAAILGLNDEVVKTTCANISNDDKIVEVANFNSPGQVVISGHKKGVELACIMLKEQGAKKAIVLPISIPSHCSLMKSVADKMQNELEKVEIKLPNIPVLHNYNCEVAKNKVDIINYLVQQLYMPVLWTKTINKLKLLGVVSTVEAGPGKVLFNLNKRIDKELKSFAINSSADFDNLDLVQQI